MIIKSFEIKKIKINNFKFYLFYGDNEGLKEETIKNLFEQNYQDKINRYEEKEVLNNINIFFDNVLTKSFFDNEKLIIINRATDKIRTTIEDLIEKNPEDILDYSYPIIIQRIFIDAQHNGMVLSHGSNRRVQIHQYYLGHFRIFE